MSSKLHKVVRHTENEFYTYHKYSASNEKSQYKGSATALTKVHLREKQGKFKNLRPLNSMHNFQGRRVKFRSQS